MYQIIDIDPNPFDKSSHTSRVRFIISVIKCHLAPLTERILGSISWEVQKSFLFLIRHMELSDCVVLRRSVVLV